MTCRRRHSSSKRSLRISRRMAFYIDRPTCRYGSTGLRSGYHIHPSRRRAGHVGDDGICALLRYAETPGIGSKDRFASADRRHHGSRVRKRQTHQFMFQKTVNEPAEHTGRVRVPNRHHGDSLAADHQHKFWQRRHECSMGKSTSCIHLKDGWSSHFRVG